MTVNSAYALWTVPLDTVTNDYTSVNTKIWLYADTTAYNNYAASLASTSTYYASKDIYDGYAIRVTAQHEIVNDHNEWGGFCLEPTYGQSYGFSCAI